MSDRPLEQGANIRTPGSIIFTKIDKNPYLNELYENILYNYSLKLFSIRSHELKPVEIEDALRFADLLSKSTHPTNSDRHKAWAQEIVALLRSIYHPEDHPAIDLMFGAVLANTGNLPGRTKLAASYQSHDLLDRIYSEFADDFMIVPAEPTKRFLRTQKIVYDRLNDPFLSYSGPTSMGKSFIMQMFLKEQVDNNRSVNFCILVPTKALINEVSDEIIKVLKTQLVERNYRVVTSAGALVLEREQRPNLIFVLTPERLLYLLTSYEDIDIDYLFIDEAHKISAKDSRSAFYYKDIDLLQERAKKPHIIFASPNIPNPKIYLKLIPSIENAESFQLPTKFSPVSQIKYLLDLVDGKIQLFNGYKGAPYSLSPLGRIQKNTKLVDIILRLERSRMTAKDSQTIVYFNNKEKAIEYARLYAEQKNSKNNTALLALAKEIRSQINDSYYLAEIITKGVAYHVGYLPTAIRRRIEELYRNGDIDVLFCTSTLIEGVNLPADNLFITTNWRGPGRMKEVDFRNLVGRVGRIKYNLYGNVFLTRIDASLKPQEYIDLLQKPIPDQEISLVTALNNEQKKLIISCLLRGDLELQNIAKPQSYDLMRRFSLILLKDILKGRNSAVKKAFAEFLDLEIECKIKELFAKDEIKPDEDINTSVDQIKGIHERIRKNNLAYPVLIDIENDTEKQNYNNIVAFLTELFHAFKWTVYEKNAPLGNLNNMTWLAVVLKRWIGGYGLGYIIAEAISYYEDNPYKFYVNHQPSYYNRSQAHKNIVIGETLELIEHTLLFSLSNYFLRFTDAYKKIHNITGALPNDWYEYIEYGTTNPLTIMMQRNGFSRETALFIREKRADYVVYTPSSEPRLRRSILTCGNLGVEEDVGRAVYNAPEIFVD